MTTYAHNIAGVPISFEIEDLPAPSIQHAIMYGLDQYLQDGAAVAKYVRAKKGEPADDKGNLLDAEGNKVERTAEEILAEKQKGVRERLDNLLKGEFKRRNVAGPELSPEEEMRQRVVIEIIVAGARKSKTQIPPRTGKKADPEWWAAKIEANYNKNKGWVDKEVARRLKEQAVEIEL